MTTIEEFIEARIAADEQIARWSTQGPARLEYDWEPVMYERQVDLYVETVADSSGVFLAEELGRPSDHVARHDPARVLRQCAAMRLILVEHARTPGGRCSVCRDFDDRRNYDGAAYPCPTVRALTAIWSDHPDYQQEWSA